MLARVRTPRTDVIEPMLATHGGRLFKTMGDGFLLEFPCAVRALRCKTARSALSM
jgi:adenylate cyclase